jgi:hypothetical protein
MSRTFTILSTNAPLVEVDGDGPTVDRPGGLTVVDGVATTAPVALLNGFIRRFRVDAPSTTKTIVVVTESPFGAFVGLRRCVPTPTKKRAGIFSVDRWPRVRRAMMRVAPTVGAIWHLLTADVLASPSCTWKDIGDDVHDTVIARGGDLVVVTFVVP